MKDAGCPGRNLTDEERKIFEGLINSAYKRFVKLVSEGRNMSEDKVRENRRRQGI